MKQFGIITLILLFSSGCVVVGGYSSERGWFIWPGTIVLLLVVALLFCFCDDAKRWASLTNALHITLSCSYSNIGLVHPHSDLPALATL